MPKQSHSSDAATGLQKAHGAVAGWLTYAPKDEFPRALAALDAFVAESRLPLIDAAITETDKSLVVLGSFNVGL